jgi:putative endonuclease
MNYYLYILLCENNHLYIGISEDVQKRFDTHRSGYGAELTKKNKPIKIVYTERFDSLKEARKREIQIKKWSREKKQKLITGTIGKK